MSEERDFSTVWCLRGPERLHPVLYATRTQAERGLAELQLAPGWDDHEPVKHSAEFDWLPSHEGIVFFSLAMLLNPPVDRHSIVPFVEEWFHFRLFIPEKITPDILREVCALAKTLAVERKPKGYRVVGARLISWSRFE